MKPRKAIKFDMKNYLFFIESKKFPTKGTKNWTKFLNLIIVDPWTEKLKTDLVRSYVLVPLVKKTLLYYNKSSLMCSIPVQMCI